MGERLHNTKLSAIIAELQRLQRVYGDLPICSEGNPPENTTVELTVLKQEPTGDYAYEVGPSDKVSDGKVVFIQLW